MILFQLFYEFFFVGLFSFGGGMATLPLLVDLGVRTGWFDSAFVTEMVAISESTPGPIGINMATYVGYQTANNAFGPLVGILGGIIASIAVAMPGIILATIVGKFLAKFSSNKIVNDVFFGIRPVVIGLILFAAYSVLRTVFFNFSLIGTGASISQIISFPKLIYFAIITFIILKFKKHPIIYIAISAVVGIVFAF